MIVEIALSMLTLAHYFKKVMHPNVIIQAIDTRATAKSSLIWTMILAVANGKEFFVGKWI